MRLYVYKGYSFPNLISTMREQGDDVKSLAGKIGIAPPSLSRRLKKKKDFELSEITKICSLYNKSFEDLFLDKESV